MFKYRLTHYFFSAWVRDCQATKLAKIQKPELIRCSLECQAHWNRFLNEEDLRMKAVHLFTAIVYLKDCQSILEKDPYSHDEYPDLWNHFEIIEKRLGEIYLSLADNENGQMRMLG